MVRKRRRKVVGRRKYASGLSVGAGIRRRTKISHIRSKKRGGFVGLGVLASTLLPSLIGELFSK